MELIQGRKDDLEARRERRKERYRRVMLECRDPRKVFHAAVRWYGMRKKGETDSEAEFELYQAILGFVAHFPPAWIATEFPAKKVYDGRKFGCKDYYSSMETLREAKDFNGDVDALNDFLWDWLNNDTIGFVIAGMTLVDELREMRGMPSMMVEFMESQGVHPIYEKEGGMLFDHNGQFLCKKKKPRTLSMIRGGVV